MRGNVVHDPNCNDPLNEHSGNEACLSWEKVDDEIKPIAVAHYTQGPQGNQIADYRADFFARYGPVVVRRPLGSPGIEDRRDNRDPEIVGRDHISGRKKIITSAPEITIREDQWHGCGNGN